MAYSITGFYPDPRAGGLRIHTYKSTDAQATVEASGYFNDLTLIVNVGDKIECYNSTDDINYVLRVIGNSSGTVTTTAISTSFEAVTTTEAVTAKETGKTFLLNSATGFVTTLPAAKVGLRYKFIVGTAPTSGNHTVVTASSANVIHGQISSAEDAAGSVSTAASADTISFVENKAIIGDWAEVVCDGTRWFVSGMCNVQDGMTTTQAS